MKEYKRKNNLTIQDKKQEDKTDQGTKSYFKQEDKTDQGIKSYFKQEDKTDQGTKSYLSIRLFMTFLLKYPLLAYLISFTSTFDTLYQHI